MGPDEAMGEAVLLGPDGGVCTGANIWPSTFKAMYEAATRGDVAEVRRLQKITTTSSYLLYGLGSGQIGFLKGVKAAASISVTRPGAQSSVPYRREVHLK